jgi:hypothetical protein
VIAAAAAVAVTVSASTTRSVVRIRQQISHDAQTAIQQFEHFIDSNTQ